MPDSVRPHRWQPTRLPCPWDSPGNNTGVGCRFLLQCMKVKSESEVAQSCPTLSDPTDCSPPGSSIHGIFQARVLEWVVIAFSVTGTEDVLKLEVPPLKHVQGKYVTLSLDWVARRSILWKYLSKKNIPDRGNSKCKDWGGNMPHLFKQVRTSVVGAGVSKMGEKWKMTRKIDH